MGRPRALTRAHSSKLRLSVSCYRNASRIVTPKRRARRPTCNLLYQRRNESFCRAIRVRVDGRTSARRTINIHLQPSFITIHRRVRVKWTTHPPIARHIETTTTLDDDKNVMYEFKLFTQTNPDQTSAHAHGIIHPSIHPSFST